MSDAFITRRGGSSAKAFAVIHVDYPAGSICTCTNGTKTLKAKDTSGVWNFLVPESGNWIVECHTTGKEKSQTVAISSQGQAESVRLAYELRIYDYGYQDTAVTGGFSWVQGSSSMVTFEPDHIKFAISAKQNDTVYQTGVVDLSRYSRIRIKANSSGNGTHTLYVRVTDPDGQTICSWSNNSSTTIGVDNGIDLTGSGLNNCRIRVHGSVWSGDNNPSKLNAQIYQIIAE